MNRKILAAALTALLCFTAVSPALAANVFVFTEKAVTLYEGETAQTTLQREGSYEGDGEITYSSSRPAVAEVSPDGTVTAAGKGQTVIAANLIRNGKRVGRAQMTVTVIRAVKKVTLNTAGLAVYAPDDPMVAGLLEAPTDKQVIVLPAGSGVNLTTTCTPEDASNRSISYTTSDAGVARISGRAMKAVQRGECDLTVASVQNPEVTETFRVLVTQPVKKVEINSGERKVAAGSQIQLTAECSPENASIRSVVWTSKNPAVATVDENGVVTGMKRGSVTINAAAADGSRAGVNVTITVTQPVTGISFAEAAIPVIVGRTATAKVTVLPADASDKGVLWSSSDDSIATVQNGRITGRKAGTCTVTCTSRSDPDVSSSVTVNVSQLVTKIECTNSPEEMKLLVGQGVATVWNVLPDDATNKGLTFKSNHPKVVQVDSSGYVTAMGRGTGTIVATAADGSRKQGTVKVTVIQPVTGVKMQRNLYYVQRGWGANIRAVVEPRNANNQKVYWASEDEGIATIRSNGTSTGRVHGVSSGTTTVTAYTEDGGFIATARVRVGSFNEAVLVEELTVNAKNEIKISMRNMSSDIVLENIHFVIECYDMSGNPMVCNKDGTSTSFEGNYPYTLYPYDRTVHGAFRFKNYSYDQPLGAVVLTVTSWRDNNGVTWSIPQSEQIRTQWTRLFPIP